MAIEIVNRQRQYSIDKQSVVQIAATALAEADHADATVAVAFVRDNAMRKLNRAYRNKDAATDVLSFPANEAESNGRLYLGDLAIGVDRAGLQAEQAGHSFHREIGELVIHGILHLCGYDHETDNGEMNRFELKLRRKLKRSLVSGTSGRIS